MEKQEKPGIMLDGIQLAECNMAMNEVTEYPMYNIQITAFKKLRGEGEDERFVIISFDMMKDIKKPFFNMEATFIAKYSRTPESNMTWDEFNDEQAVGHIIPYLREFVNNMTHRMPSPDLVIDPINCYVLYEEYLERCRKEEAKAKKVAKKKATTKKVATKRKTQALSK